MIEIICGEKGKGKTKQLLDKVNNEVKNIKFLLTKNSTPACNTAVIAITTGPIA